MAAGYTFLGQVFEQQHLALANGVLVGGALGALGLAAKRSLNSAENKIIPEERFSTRMIFETVTQFMLSIADSTMGKENRRYIPFVATIFLFLFAINILGLAPGFILSSDYFQFDAGIALAVFTMYNFWGIKELGFGKYLAHFWIPGKPESTGQLILMILVGFIIFPLELMSHAIRPATLSLRIFGNMTGDHSLISAMNNLAHGAYGFFNLSAFPFYFLGTIVCFIQAFIFALLTMVYIRLAVAH